MENRKIAENRHPVKLVCDGFNYELVDCVTGVRLGLVSAYMLTSNTKENPTCCITISLDKIEIINPVVERITQNNL